MSLEIENKLSMSLSEMFDYADKNLHHVRIINGIPNWRCACAIGTIAFVLSDGKTTVPKNLKTINMALWYRYKYLRQEFKKRNGVDLVILNDLLMWSFPKLRDKAKELGL